MKKNLIQMNLLILIFLISSVCYATTYETYNNNTFSYKISIPNLWKKEVLDYQDKHSMYVSADSDTSINIIVLKSDKDDLESIIHKKKWDLWKIDPGLNNIIETGRLELNKNLAGKLLIFEYRLNRHSILQRTLVTTNGKYIYIIECKSKVSTFYKYEEIFTSALASFMITGSNNVSNPEENIEEKNETEQTEEKAAEKDSLEEEKL